MISYTLCVRDTVQDGKGAAPRFSTGLGEAAYLAVPWSGKRADLRRAPGPQPSDAMGDARAWMEAVVAYAKTGRPAEQPLDVVFFVHGCNTDAREAQVRQRLVELELRARGCDALVVGFDWPTGGTAAAYLYDRALAARAALALVSKGIFPFALFSKEGCPVRVHVMAHSMGAFVVREAFRGADKARLAGIPNDWRIGQLVLLAADLSSRCFAAGHPDLRPTLDHCGRLTNYFSAYDEALAVSNVKNLDISSRVGRVGMPVDLPTSVKAVDVDCGPRHRAVEDRPLKVVDGIASHSWYFEDPLWYDDLAWTLKGAVDRNAIPTRRPAGQGLPDDLVLEAPNPEA
jgi:pimeloyl-ACP methyl ester carboxylesterase